MSNKITDLNVFSCEVLNAARNQVTKKGKPVMRTENSVLIANFMTFDLSNDWMESKDHTKLGKILAMAVVTGCKLVDETLENVKLWNSIISLREDRQSWNKPTDKDIEKMRLMSPIVNKWEDMLNNNRLTRNGKFPKSEEERRRREAIKGALNPKLSASLTVIKEDWRKIIYANEIKSMEASVEQVTPYLQVWNATGVPKDDQRWAAGLLVRGIIVKGDNQFTHKQVIAIAPKSSMEEKAKRLADDECESFFFKMADKLGGLVAGKREFLSVESGTHFSKTTPFSSWLVFNFANDTRFGLENKIVWNTSPLGTQFYQYPATFHNFVLDGKPVKNISELEVKKAFMTEVTLRVTK